MYSVYSWHIVSIFRFNIYILLLIIHHSVLNLRHIQINKQGKINFQLILESPIFIIETLKLLSKH